MPNVQPPTLSFDERVGDVQEILERQRDGLMKFSDIMQNHHSCQQIAESLGFSGHPALSWASKSSRDPIYWKVIYHCDPWTLYTAAPLQRNSMPPPPPPPPLPPPPEPGASPPEDDARDFFDFLDDQMEPGDLRPDDEVPSAADESGAIDNAIQLMDGLVDGQDAEAVEQGVAVVMDESAEQLQRLRAKYLRQSWHLLFARQGEAKNCAVSVPVRSNLKGCLSLLRCADHNSKPSMCTVGREECEESLLRPMEEQPEDFAGVRDKIFMKLVRRFPSRLKRPKTESSVVLTEGHVGVAIHSIVKCNQELREIWINAEPMSTSMGDGQPRPVLLSLDDVCPEVERRALNWRTAPELRYRLSGQKVARLVNETVEPEALYLDDPCAEALLKEMLSGVRGCRVSALDEADRRKGEILQHWVRLGIVAPDPEDEHLLGLSHRGRRCVDVCYEMIAPRSGMNHACNSTNSAH